MNQEVFLEILALHLVPFGLNKYGNNWILHQDKMKKNAFT